MICMRASLFPILLASIAALLGAAANWCFKRSALQFVETPIYKNLALGLGLLAFTAVLVLFTLAYRSGGKLLVIYPAYATTYIWALLIAKFVDHEAISTAQVAGILAIMIGVTLIGVGAKA